MVSIDQLQPYLVDLIDVLNKLQIPQYNDYATKFKNWLITFNALKASDELKEDQVRQLLFDLDSGYNAFHKVLAS